jgi:paraquat-inducible protein B
MAKQANRMVIGGFVVIAVFLLAASVVVFGSGKFFKKKQLYLMYFDTSIKGLNVGSPVLFQGVPIGSVTHISLRTYTDTVKTEIPITIEVEQGQFEVVGKGNLSPDYRERVQKLIDNGLRAVLGLQSLITGQLVIELDFHPNTPVNLRGTDDRFPEIPTIPSTTERLVQTLQKLDLEGMQKDLENALTGIDKLVNDPDLKASIGELKGLLTDARGLVQHLDGRIDPLAEGMKATLSDTRRLVNNVNDQVAPTAANFNRTVEDFGQLARHADRQLETLSGSLEKTLAGVRGVMSEDAPLVVELETTLQEISAMARAFRQLAEYLERHPESLIQGKGNAGGN